MKKVINGAINLDKKELGYDKYLTEYRTLVVLYGPSIIDHDELYSGILSVVIDNLLYKDIIPIEYSEDPTVEIIEPILEELNGLNVEADIDDFSGLIELYKDLINNRFIIGACDLLREGIGMENVTYTEVKLKQGNRIRVHVRGYDERNNFTRS